MLPALLLTRYTWVGALFAVSKPVQHYNPKQRQTVNDLTPDPKPRTLKRQTAQDLTAYRDVPPTFVLTRYARAGTLFFRSLFQRCFPFALSLDSEQLTLRLY